MLSKMQKPAVAKREWCCELEVEPDLSSGREHAQHSYIRESLAWRLELTATGSVQNVNERGRWSDVQLQADQAVCETWSLLTGVKSEICHLRRHSSHTGSASGFNVQTMRHVQTANRKRQSVKC